MQTYKLINAVKAYTSFIISSILHKTQTFGLPILYSVETSSICNLNCPQCPSGLGQLTRRRGIMDMGTYDSILNKISKYAMYISFYMQGEPFFNKDIYEMIKKAKEKGIYTATSTNGQLITADVANKIVESKLDKIIISIDGAKQESYEKYRIGGDLAKVIDAIKYIREAKKNANAKTPKIVAQMLIFSHNEDEIYETKTLALRSGADEFTTKTAQIYNYENGNKLMPSEKNSRYARQTDGKFKVKRRLHNRCIRIFTSADITIDGDVIPCSFDKDAQHKYGNLTKSDLKDIWLSHVAQKHRETVLNNRNSIEMCRNCVY